MDDGCSQWELEKNHARLLSLWWPTRLKRKSSSHQTSFVAVYDNKVPSILASLYHKVGDVWAHVILRGDVQAGCTSTTGQWFCRKVTEDKTRRTQINRGVKRWRLAESEMCWLSAWRGKTCPDFLDLEKARQTIWNWPTESGSELWFYRVPVIMTGLCELNTTSLIPGCQGWVEFAFKCLNEQLLGSH